jgi:hypothetical protein
MARRRFEIPAGERTIVIDRRSGSVPREYVLEIIAPDGRAVTGTVEIQGSRWLSRKNPETIPIAPEVRAYKGFWDTLFRVTVTPDSDVVVTVR